MDLQSLKEKRSNIIARINMESCEASETYLLRKKLVKIQSLINREQFNARAR